VGWTQHTVGVQYIRTAGIVQALLGNIGRPGGGILALRGHATIQGSTDIATLYNLLPGYLPAPSAQLREHDTLDGYLEREMPATGWWANGRKYMVSFLKAWYGDAATAENEWGYHFLPRNVGDHSHIPMFKAMHDGVVNGFMALGQNPAVGGQNAVYQRAGMAKLDWMVVKDLFLTETAEFWRAPGVDDPSTIRTEVFFFPAASVPEMSGSFTNTQRLIQWHEKAVDPRGDCRSDIWFTHQLVRRLKRLYGYDERGVVATGTLTRSTGAAGTADTARTAAPLVSPRRHQGHPSIHSLPCAGSSRRKGRRLTTASRARKASCARSMDTPSRMGSRCARPRTSRTMAPPRAARGSTRASIPSRE
jgi:formate dehydrogenase major subunit